MPSKHTRGNPGHSHILFTLTLLLCWAGYAGAQPDLPVTRLLFEPVPIPAEGEAETVGSFTALEDLPAIMPSADIEEEGMDAATRQQLSADIQGYVTAIGDKEAEEGPYSNQLVQDLFSAGLLSQQLEVHEQALDFFERARNVSRINEGLETMDQVPMIEGEIESLYALGRLLEADEKQDNLLQIYQDSYGADSLEAASALHNLGDWNLQAFLERSNIALNIDRMNVPNFLAQNNYNATDNTASALFMDDISDPTQTPLFKLYLAQRNYLNAINILIQGKDYTHPELLDLERKYMTTAFLRTHQENIVYEPDFYLNRKTKATGTRIDTSAQDRVNSSDYDEGLKSLQRSLAYIAQNEQRTMMQVASAMLEEGDWHMLFERKVVARDKYEEAYAFFAQYPEQSEQIADYLYSDTPIVLPTFLPAPNSREKLGIAEDADVHYIGYFDVTFSVNRNGQARGIRIRDQGGEVTRNMEIRLNQYLKNVLFRPRYDREGKLNTDDYSLRYYVGL